MISTRLRTWQRRRGLTNQAAADLLGVPKRTFEDWRDARRQPRGLTAEMLKLKLQAAGF